MHWIGKFSKDCRFFSVLLGIFAIVFVGFEEIEKKGEACPLLNLLGSPYKMVALRFHTFGTWRTRKVMAIASEDIEPMSSLVLCSTISVHPHSVSWIWAAGVAGSAVRSPRKVIMSP